MAMPHDASKRQAFENEKEVEQRCPRRLRSCWLWALVWVQSGLGMFTESYYIFSTGQVKSIWKQAYPTCWAAGSNVACPERVRCYGTFNNTPVDLLPLPASDAAVPCDAFGEYPTRDLCAGELLQAVSYGEFAGIMAGMLTMGFIAVRMGLKWTSVLCIAIMGTGAVLMTASAGGGGLSGLFLMFSISYSLFGFGVGGEYPTAAVGHTERHAEANDHKDQDVLGGGPGRGRAVQLMFSMQGWGAVAGSVVICIALAAFGFRAPDCSAAEANEMGYDAHKLSLSWRLLYGLGLLPITYTLYHRIFEVHEPKRRAQMMEEQMQQQDDGDEAGQGACARTPFLATLGLFVRTFWPRLLGTALSWFLWDVCFYGNKLFSAPIFAALLGSQAKLLAQNLYILLNNCVALSGYWLAALVIDWPRVGRVRLQASGFLICGVLFLVCGLGWTHLAPWSRLLLYMMTSLWGQMGPNATTYILPSESFPSQVRTIGHGVSAFSGKAGALLATILFEHLQRHAQGTQVIFLVCAGTCLLGAVATLLLCCNLAGLSLRDQEEHWVAVKCGKAASYSGEAVNPEHLSFFERRVLCWGRPYVSRGRDAMVVELLGRPGVGTGEASAFGHAGPEGRVSNGGRDHLLGERAPV